MYLKQPALLLHSSEDWALLKAAALEEMTNEAAWKADVKYLLMYLVSIFRSVYKVRGQMELPSQAYERSIPRSIEDFLEDLNSRLQ